MVKNLPATAGDMGSIPGPGRFLMLWGTGTDVPQLLSLCFRVHALQQEKPLQEAHAPQLEKALSQQRRPSTAKNKSIQANKRTLQGLPLRSSSQDSMLLLQGEWVPVVLSSDRGGGGSRVLKILPTLLPRAMASTCPFLDGSTEGAVQWLLDVMLSSTQEVTIPASNRANNLGSLSQEETICPHPGLIIWDPDLRSGSSSSVPSHICHGCRD